MNKTFIVAEVGINHNGDIEIAKKLIYAAKYAGADAVKFQKRTIDKVYSKDELLKYRESPWGNLNIYQKEGLEFGRQEYDEIDRVCKEIDIDWFASPWDLESVEFLKKYNLKYNKVASALLTHKELLERIAEQGKHTFISTGMSTGDEITEAVRIFEKHQCPIELMHCNSQYPMNDKDANLRVILTLQRQFTDIKIGYSGHEVGLITSVAAVALGATSIERHITLDRAMYGSDQASSVEPEGFRRLVEYIRVVESALGDGVKRVTEGEQKAKLKLRRMKDYE